MRKRRNENTTYNIHGASVSLLSTGNRAIYTEDICDFLLQMMNQTFNRMDDCLEAGGLADLLHPHRHEPTNQNMKVITYRPDTALPIIENWWKDKMDALPAALLNRNNTALNQMTVLTFEDGYISFHPARHATDSVDELGRDAFKHMTSLEDLLWKFTEEVMNEEGLEEFSWEKKPREFLEGAGEHDDLDSIYWSVYTIKRVLEAYAIYRFGLHPKDTPDFNHPEAIQLFAEEPLEFPEYTYEVRVNLAVEMQLSPAAAHDYREWLNSQQSVHKLPDTVLNELKSELDRISDDVSLLKEIIDEVDPAGA